MTERDRKVLKYTNILIFLFLGLAVISSQYSIATSSIGVGGLIILAVFRIIVFRNIYTGDKKIIYLFLLFIAAEVLSSFFAGDAKESFSNIGRRISLYIVFFSVIFFIESENQIKKFLLVFFVFSALISVIEIVKFIIDYSPAAVTPLAEYRLQYFGYPITNGQIKMMILLIMIPFMLAEKNYITGRIYIFLLSLPVFVSFYLTNARNAVLGLFTGLIVIGALKNRKFLFGVLTLTALFLIFAPESLKSRIESITNFEHPSNKTRFIMWETGVRMIKDSPVIGFGDIDINKLYRKYKTPEHHGEGSHMHNNAIQLLVNFGIAGFTAWFMLMLYLFLSQLKMFFKTRSNEFLNLLALISLVSMIALQITGLTEWNFGDAEFAVVFWFNLALAFTAWRLFSSKGNETAGS